MKNKKTYAWLLLALFAMNGCKRTEDPVFEENSAVRLTEAVQHAHKVLRDNADGWLMKYYPASSKEFGGYTLFATFISDREVTLTSDINTGSVTSSYAVLPGTGAVLTFNGYNKVIHFFSEPGADSGVGTNDRGMQGDFEFIVIEADPEKVVLKGKKSGNIIEMEPMQSATAAQVVTDYQTEAGFFDDLGAFKIKRPNGEEEDLITSLRTFKLSSDANYPAMSFRVVPGGLELSEEYELDGQKFDRLARKAPTTEYPFGYYTDASDKVVIFPVVTPLNTWFRDNWWGLRRSGFGDFGGAWWDFGRTQFIAHGYSLNEAKFGRDARDGLFVDITVGGVNSIAYFVYDIVPVANTTDEVEITFMGSYASSAGFDLAYWSNAIVYLAQPFNNKTFKITSDVGNRPNKILLTDKNDPDNTIVMELDDFPDPLNN